MTHTKRQLAALSRAQLVNTLLFLLAYLRAHNPKAYHAAEKKMGLGSRKTSGRHKHRRKKRGLSRGKRRSSRRASPAQMRARKRFAAFVRRHKRAPRKGEKL